MSQETKIPIYTKTEFESKLKELNRVVEQLSKHLSELSDAYFKIVNTIEDGIRRFNAKINYESYWYTITKHIYSVECLVEEFLVELVSQVLNPYRERSREYEFLDGEKVLILGEVIIRESNRRAKLYTNGMKIDYYEL
jgi:hypothetical protein